MADAGEPIDFDTAQYEGEAPSQVSCRFCQQPITDYYYQVAGQPACKRCQVKLGAELARSPRFWRAAGLGLLAAAVGSALWYAVGVITGYEIGLIAIAVGLLVGGAVKLGSGGVGGLSVQLLAVVLTYTSIVSSYAPAMIAEFQKVAQEPSQQGGISRQPGAGEIITAVGDTGSFAPAVTTLGGVEAMAFLGTLDRALTAWAADSGTGVEQERMLDTTFGALQALLAVNPTPRFGFSDSSVTYAGAPLAALGAWPRSAQMVQAGYASLNFQASVTRLDVLRLLDAVQQSAQSVEMAGPLQVALALAVLVAFLYLAPILAGIENIIGMLIIGFALYEAWKINTRPKVEITGPFQVKPAAPATS